MIDWEDLAYTTAERFGGNLPHPETAAQIAAAYVKAPHAVEKAIDRIALEYEQGTVRSPWGLLLSRVKQIQADHTTATRGNDRDKAIARAEQWIRNAGLMYDREDEILDELYGDRGSLRHHPETKERILELWRELRPAGELVEAEAIQRGHRYQAQRHELNTIPSTETDEQKLERQRQLAAVKAGLA